MKKNLKSRISWHCFFKIQLCLHLRASSHSLQKLTHPAPPAAFKCRAYSLCSSFITPAIRSLITSRHSLSHHPSPLPLTDHSFKSLITPQHISDRPLLLTGHSSLKSVLIQTTLSTRKPEFDLLFISNTSLTTYL